MSDNYHYTSPGQEKDYVHAYQCSSSRHNNRLNNENLITLSSNEQGTESSIHSVNTIETNESAAQTVHHMQTWVRSLGTQKNNATGKNYMKRISSLSSQKSSTNSSSFNRQRFTDYQMAKRNKIIDENNNQRNNYSNKITTIQEVISDNQPYSNQFTNEELILVADSSPSRWSEFLIDNCDQVQPVRNVLPNSSISSATTEQSTILVNKFNVSYVERRKEWKCRKQVERKSIKNKYDEQPSVTSDSIPLMNDDYPQESLSDWIIEYDTTDIDQISQLTDVAKKMSRKMTDETKIDRINIMVKKIKKQQLELRKLRKHLMFMLHEESKSNLTNTDQDVLMKFINQPTTSGCWLCSGKTYTEVATQCGSIN